MGEANGIGNKFCIVTYLVRFVDRTYLLAVLFQPPAARALPPPTPNSNRLCSILTTSHSEENPRSLPAPTIQYPFMEGRNKKRNSPVSLYAKILASASSKAFQPSTPV